MEDGFEQEARAEVVIRLAGQEAEVVVTDVKNPALEGKICIGFCIASVNGRSLLTQEYEEAMQTLKNEMPNRPLKITFISPDGLNTVEHVFEEEGPLMLRFSHRIKFLNDELNSVQEVLLTSPKPRRKELKSLVNQMEEAINGSQAAFTATQSRRRSKSASQIMPDDLPGDDDAAAPGLGMPGEPLPGSVGAEAAAAAAAAVATEEADASCVQALDETVEALSEDPAAASASVIGVPESDLEARVKELEVQNQLLKAENAKLKEDLSGTDQSLKEENAKLKEELAELKKGAQGTQKEGGFGMPSMGMPEMKMPSLNPFGGSSEDPKEDGDKGEESSGGMFGGLSMPSMPSMPKVPGMSGGSEGEDSEKKEEESSGGMFGGFSMPSMPEMKMPDMKMPDMKMPDMPGMPGTSSANEESNSEAPTGS